MNQKEKKEFEQLKEEHEETLIQFGRTIAERDSLLREVTELELRWKFIKTERGMDQDKIGAAEILAASE